MPHHSNAPVLQSSLAYYITAHGYGHAARSCDILHALFEADPGLKATVVSQLDPAFLAARLPSANVVIRAEAFDVGMVQLDSIRVDTEATLARGLDLVQRRDDLLARELAFLREAGVSAVVADIPSLPLAAASLENIPAIAVGNFGWDWIYEEFAEADARWKPLVRFIADGYARADLLLRLPFAEPMRAFRRAEDLPLVTRPGRSRRDELARITGANPAARWSLLSFTSLDWTEAALDNVERLGDFEFFTLLPLAWNRPNIHAVDRRQVSYSDVMASVDVVVSKPGFGVLSDCVVNRKPLVYAARSDFREYHVLVDSIRRYLRHVHIPNDRLYRGEIGDEIRAALVSAEPQLRLEAGGDVLAAKRILSFL